MTGRTLRKVSEASDHLLRGARYDWVERYTRTELGALAEIAEDTDRMVRNCLETLDELRRE